MNELYAAVRAAILCARGRHCAPRRQIVKFDKGRNAHLCCYCRVILFWEWPIEEIQ